MKTVQEFIQEALRQGFTIRQRNDGFLTASKKNIANDVIRFEVTPFDFDFCDGKNKEPKVQVFENGRTNRSLEFRLSEFNMHD